MAALGNVVAALGNVVAGGNGVAAGRAAPVAASCGSGEVATVASRPLKSRKSGFVMRM
ncbi:hypothetical protein DF3PB_1180004 [uncultured Defluviicoccus sp.]|uniref:Uncharacterized protein n=1 Tax=metagenome TaxID=256318 RepID=A0A380T8C9_9ZZZZ|nr:hypothetical protein DF3PB_1180004 [uncultured Defluviicoccus sp.]